MPADHNEGSRFTFVLDNTQASTRTHAMRVHWIERRKAKQGKKQPAVRKILPRESTLKDSESTEVAKVPDRSIQRTPSLPTQLLTGLNHALSSSKLDPFYMFPVALTSEHHKLIHHWLSTHATMMFDNMPASIFNPMRDVWFPLDLSNAASFNAIMAHSAAHLAHYYGGTNPTSGTNSAEALKFKADAVGILNHWLNDPRKTLDNDTFAAAVRILTFERYWGTEDEWKIHRNGVQSMIEARGGLDQLHNDWRLKLVVGLVSLMSKPSWFESSNDLSEISNHPIKRCILGTSVDLHKMRCLWLISFIQDMRNLMGMSTQLYMDGLEVLPSLYDAVLFIRNDFELEQKLEADYMASVNDRLTCLFAICILVQESVSLAYAAPNNALNILDMSLHTAGGSWTTSIHSLRSFLHGHFVNYHPQGTLKIDYVMQMTDIVSNLSVEAHRGIEKCLLNMLCRTRDGRLPFSVDDEGTPDALLSSVHGN